VAEGTACGLSLDERSGWVITSYEDEDDKPQTYDPP